MDGLTALGKYLVRHEETQGDFATRAKVPAPMVSLWSRLDGIERRIPALDNALKIRDATGGEVPLEYWVRLREQRNNRRRKAARIA